MRKKRKTIGHRAWLQGQIECITMMQLREGPGDIVTQIQMGKRFVLTRAGKAVAVMHKPSPWEIAQFSDE